MVLKIADLQVNIPLQKGILRNFLFPFYLILGNINN